MGLWRLRIPTNALCKLEDKKTNGLVQVPDLRITVWIWMPDDQEGWCLASKGRRRIISTQAQTANSPFPHFVCSFHWRPQWLDDVPWHWGWRCTPTNSNVSLFQVPPAQTLRSNAFTMQASWSSAKQTRKISHIIYLAPLPRPVPEWSQLSQCMADGGGVSFEKRQRWKWSVRSCGPSPSMYN